MFENVLENQKIGGDKEEMRRRRGGNKALFTKYEVGTWGSSYMSDGKFSVWLVFCCCIFRYFKTCFN